MLIFKRLINWYFSRNALPFWCILLIDYCIIIASGLVCNYLLKGGSAVANHFWDQLSLLLLMLIPFTVAFHIFHTYNGIFRYSSFVDLSRLCCAVLIGTGLAYGLHFLLPSQQVLFMDSPETLLIFALLCASFMCAVRVVVKTLHDVFRTNEHCRRIFIYSTQQGGISLAKSIRNETPSRYEIVAFVSPSAAMQGHWLMGVPVYTDSDDLVALMHEKRATVIMVSPTQAEHFRELKDTVNALIAADIKIMMMPNAAEEWDGKSEVNHNLLHKVDIEDLLPRDKIEVNMEAIGKQLQGSRILITGAAGSIGSEMVRQVATFKPKEMILIDQAETPMHDVRRMMASGFPDIKCHTIVASITNQTYMENIFRRFTPEYVFHAAAYKHVPMMEDNPSMAVQNNIYGTRVIADLAAKYGTKKFVMISTDKAVNPTNVMGCSKRICEIYCQALNKKLWEETQATGRRTTQFVTTRFGNVLGSNGSVIPIFKEQIAKGGPVTVTHPDIIRFFMLIPEACRLVLEAGTMGNGGEIFVFDMGKPVRIADLAKNMIRLSGASKCKIQFTGLRDGEKLYEEVLNDAELTVPTAHNKILVAKVREYDYEEACRNEERLLEASYTYDDMAIVKIMKEIVPEFKSHQSKYETLD